MKIDATLEIEMFDDQAEKIFLEFLKKEYTNQVQSPLIVVPLDAVDNNSLIAAMARVIDYYTTVDEYKEFMEEVHGE